MYNRSSLAIRKPSGARFISGRSVSRLWFRPTRAATGVAALVVSAMVALTGCHGASGADGSGAANNNILTVQVNTAGPQQQNFNPLLASSPSRAINDNWALIYEPLLQFDVAKPGYSYPWLATHWTWSDNGRVLTLDLRHGVKWSDDTPFTATDVAYTFNLIKKYPALNIEGINFASVATVNPYTVKITFSAPAFVQLYYISQLPIVPEHIWSKIGNPTTYADPHPVGTGPYILASFSPNQILYQANPRYWQPVHVKEVEYLIISSTPTAVSELVNGGIQWETGGEPDFQRIFVDKDPAHNHYWYPAIGPVSLLPNTTVYPLNLAAVRQAISDAIDRQIIDSDGEFGYEAPITTATGLVSNESKYVDPAYASDTLTHDVAKARALLRSAGFHWNPSGRLIGAHGPVSLTIEDPSGFTDYMSDCQIIATELDKIGISVTVDGISANTWNADLADGHFQLTVDWSSVGPTPYYSYDSLLDYNLSGPVGANANGDFERWHDPSTQKYLAAYVGAATATAQQTALNGIEKVMVQDLPVIPLVGSADWGTYSSLHFVGWPTPSNPYADDSPTAGNGLAVLLHLRPR